MVWNNGSWFFYANGYQEFGAQNRATGHKLVLRIEKTFAVAEIDELIHAWRRFISGRLSLSGLLVRQWTSSSLGSRLITAGLAGLYRSPTCPTRSAALRQDRVG